MVWSLLCGGSRLEDRRRRVEVFWRLALPGSGFALCVSVCVCFPFISGISNARLAMAGVSLQSGARLSSSSSMFTSISSDSSVRPCLPRWRKAAVIVSCAVVKDYNYKLLKCARFARWCSLYLSRESQALRGSAECFVSRLCCFLVVSSETYSWTLKTLNPKP